MNHVHSQYSDGAVMEKMLDASVEAGVAGIGFADQCDLTTLDDGDESHLARTYERRRADIDRY